MYLICLPEIAIDHTEIKQVGLFKSPPTVYLKHIKLQQWMAIAFLTALSYNNKKTQGKTGGRQLAPC